MYLRRKFRGLRSYIFLFKRVKLLYNLEEVALNVGQNCFKDFCLKR